MWTPENSMFKQPVYLGDIQWLIEQFENLPTEKLSLRVSEWAEKKRYLPPEVSDDPGQWDNSFMPFLTEIMDNLGPDSPARDIVLMKPRQIGATTGPIENWIGYIIDVDPAPTMYLTGSEALAKASIEVKLDRMIEYAGLEGKIRGNVRSGRKLSGNTTTRKDFAGGFLLSYGAQSTAKIKGISIKYLILDEVEELPVSLRKQGSVIQLALSQQMAYDKTRKTFYSSTPGETDGAIHILFKKGDQRYYYVPCRYCGYMQVLTFHGRRDDGKAYGIYYEFEDDRLLLSSVEYRCKNCLKGWREYDKYDFLNAGEWRPTDTPVHPFFYSYKLDSLYSPKFSWESLVQSWLTCWDEKSQKIIDVDALKVFMNTKRGDPFEDRSEGVSYDRVIHFRRQIYTKGEIPNTHAIVETGSPVLFLTAGADVHKNNISVEIKGWCVNNCSYSIDWLIFEGDTENLQSPAWLKFANLIENGMWVADDGKEYNIVLTLIDASYRTDEVYEFCSSFREGLFPIMGRDTPPRNARLRQFDSYTKHDLTAYNVTVTLYKNRVAGWLRRDWNTGEMQPAGYPNFPQDYRDDFFKQFDAEVRREKFKKNGARIGFVWELKKSNLPNHSWDCFIYNAAAHDMVCFNINSEILGQDRFDNDAFWTYVWENQYFFYDPLKKST